MPPKGTVPPGVEPGHQAPHISAVKLEKPKELENRAPEEGSDSPFCLPRGWNARRSETETVVKARLPRSCQAAPLPSFATRNISTLSSLVHAAPSTFPTVRTAAFMTARVCLGHMDYFTVAARASVCV